MSSEKHSPEDIALSLTLAIVRSSPAPLLLLDGQCNIIAASMSFCSVFGVDSVEVTGQPLFALYAIGAALLDKSDPSKVIGRTPNPILSAADEDREGYVPNVVYTCGAIRVGDDLFLPYGVADSSVCFAFVAIKEILAAMR